MRTLVQDFKYGFRVLMKVPVLTISALLVLAVGIGANTALFSMINEMLIEKLPVKDPGRLVLFEASALNGFDYGKTSGSTSVDSSGRLRLTAFTYQSFIRLREEPGAFADIFAFSPLTLNISSDGRSDAVD